jgi:anti-sigma regulatory factor (Ser/Thr protein kinase)
VQSAALVVSELVTNAVTHADCPCKLRVAISANALRLEVTDTGGGTPDPFSAADDDEHGRGLVLVTAIATAWGVESAPDGKTVWAEIGLVA